ncbi:hypothetical protein [Actinoplanes sp. NPDC051411]|uniref:hypothetical protein n=1 Tax=Actinoplanes sp. NPDC051411 TaxID=3155522 RepID=UPI0034245C4E
MATGRFQDGSSRWGGTAAARGAYASGDGLPAYVSGVGRVEGAGGPEAAPTDARPTPRSSPREAS